MTKVPPTEIKKAGAVKIAQAKELDDGLREISWPCLCCGKIQQYESPFSFCPTCSQSLARGY